MKPFWTKMPEQWLGNAIYLNYAVDTEEQDFQVPENKVQKHMTH